MGLHDTSLKAGLVTFVGAVVAAEALTTATARASGDKQHEAPKPVVKGIGKGLFEIGPQLYEDNFAELDNWVTQVQSTDADVPDARVETRDNKLEVFVPARGATVWFKPKLAGPVAIVYQVRCPKMPKTPGVVPRDVNNFWHMSITRGADDPGALFDESRYTGNFGTYHELVGYYASTGGRDNTTTRFRRYRREIDGDPADHIALQYRDNEEPYLITPGKTHTVQLVAYNGNVQYIVDEKVVYELRYGDGVTINRYQDGDRNRVKVNYTRERFPAYNDGWFGFRMTTTYHIYSNFRVYRLTPADD